MILIYSKPSDIVGIKNLVVKTTNRSVELSRCDISHCDIFTINNNCNKMYICYAASLIIYNNCQYGNNFSLKEKLLTFKWEGTNGGK